MTRDEEEQHDPEGLPLDRKLSKQASDEVAPTSAGVTPTSPSPLTGRPAALKLDQVDDPGAVNAPRIAVQATKGEGKNTVKEYVPSVVSRLPDQISARQVQADRSNPDGCSASEVQR
ncbi:MAG: hypothetical protein WCF61_05500 [Terriglobales bacterium]